MSSHDPCAFCVKLPATTKPSRKRTRCPLCKSDLVDFSGISYRLNLSVAGEASRWRHRILWLIMAGFAGGVWLAGRLVQDSSDGDKANRPAAPPAVVAAEPPLRLAQAPAPTPERPPQSESPAPRVRTPVGSLRGTTAPARFVDGKAKPYGEEPTRAPPPAVMEKAHIVSEEALRQQLLRTPEIVLDDSIRPGGDVGQRIAALAKQIQEKNKKRTDGFVRALIEERSELAGLPFLLGKDCQADKAKARALQEASLIVRSALAQSAEQARRAQPQAAADPDPHSFWMLILYGHSALVRSSPTPLPTTPLVSQRAGLATLLQVLAPQPTVFRRGLVDHLASVSDVVATVGLVKHAVFDLDSYVRMRAVDALRSRPTEQYTARLLEVMRHPWAPAAHHAAQAVVQLQRRDLIPRLVDMLAEADPCAPFAPEGKSTLFVRELVRVNHHRHCLLCHAPAESPRNLQDLLAKAIKCGDTKEAARLCEQAAAVVVAEVPTPGKDLPAPSGFVYLSGDARGVFVRADVTHLRQDFSVMQPVKDHKAFEWPEMQRFDFLVRIRPAKESEIAAAHERARKGTLSEHHRAVLFTLRQLAGVDLGTTAADWRSLIACSPRWRAPCAR